jgi:hypothetical protein
MASQLMEWRCHLTGENRTKNEDIAPLEEG